jgi:molybdenum cofactor biosynthesis enzyme MoaA
MKKPSTIWLSLSDICNNKCKWCYWGESINIPKELTNINKFLEIEKAEMILKFRPKAVF